MWYYITLYYTNAVPHRVGQSRIDRAHSSGGKLTVAISGYQNMRSSAIIYYTIYDIRYTIYDIRYTIYYTILYDYIPYHTIPYYTILYYTILYYTILYYTTLPFALSAISTSRPAPFVQRARFRSSRMRRWRMWCLIVIEVTFSLNY